MILDNKIQGLSYKQTPNVSKAVIVPRYLVMHYSASGTLAGTIRTLRDPKNQRSAHLVIDRDGMAVQLARFNQRAWHCGISAWKDLVGLNSYSIGIELVNWGKLKRGKDGRLLTWTNEPIDISQVIEVTHKNETAPSFWHRYTPEQIARAQDIAAELVRFYGLEDVIGHDDIAPTRKTDPGPAFPMAQVRAHCYPPQGPGIDINNTLSFTLQDGEIVIAAGAQGLKAKMNAVEARALGDWLDLVLPKEVI